MYLVFNPGTPSIIDHIKTAAEVAKQKGEPIFVRGAVSDATIAKKVTTNVISKRIFSVIKTGTRIALFGATIVTPC